MAVVVLSPEVGATRQQQPHRVLGAEVVPLRGGVQRRVPRDWRHVRHGVAELPSAAQGLDEELLRPEAPGEVPPDEGLRDLALPTACAELGQEVERQLASGKGHRRVRAAVSAETLHDLAAPCDDPTMACGNPATACAEEFLACDGQSWPAATPP